MLNILKMGFKQGDIIERINGDYTNGRGETICQGKKYIFLRHDVIGVIVKGLKGGWDPTNFELVKSKNQIINNYSIF